MIAAILAGGSGTRLKEETLFRPKAMVKIGGVPIIVHIMEQYAAHGITDFIIAIGYKGEMITKDLPGYCRTGWKVVFVDTGLDASNGNRIKKLQPRLSTETFMLTWCDGVSDINLKDLYDYHLSHGRLATVTAVRPPSRFGYLRIDNDGSWHSPGSAGCGSVVDFTEKPDDRDEWINGAFFVLEPGVFDYITPGNCHWETGPMVKLAKDNQLKAYKHNGFWQCMDTIQDKAVLETLAGKNPCPWKAGHVQPGSRKSV